jgi:hypothetical protein
MAKTKSARRSFDVPRVLDFNEIANILTYIIYSMLGEHLRYAERRCLGNRLRRSTARDQQTRNEIALTSFR